MLADGPPITHVENHQGVNPLSITVTYTDKIAVLNLGDDENRFSLAFLDEVNGHLDDIVASGARASSPPAPGSSTRTVSTWTG